MKSPSDELARATAPGSAEPRRAPVRSVGLAGPVRASETLLIDVYVLIALAWPSHQFHAVATRRLNVPHQRWPTCAITQLGFIRVSSNPAAVPHPVSPPAAVALLAEMALDPLHTYLDRLPPPTSASFLAGALGHRQVTDLYLVAVAAAIVPASSRSIPGCGSAKTLKSFPSLALPPDPIVG
jgi:uncharacterized protein